VNKGRVVADEEVDGGGDLFRRGDPPGWGLAGQVEDEVAELRGPSVLVGRGSPR